MTFFAVHKRLVAQSIELVIRAQTLGGTLTVQTDLTQLQIMKPFWLIGGLQETTGWYITVGRIVMVELLPYRKNILGKCCLNELLLQELQLLEMPRLLVQRSPGRRENIKKLLTLSLMLDKESWKRDYCKLDPIMGYRASTHPLELFESEGKVF
jgi:hypothetical protein